VAAIEASEGAAGNISVFVGWPTRFGRRFPIVEEVVLPQPAPHLANNVVIVTGSGRRLREIHIDPTANLGVVRISPGGTPARSIRRPTASSTTSPRSGTHTFAVHDDVVERTGTKLSRGRPRPTPHLTYLSHMPTTETRTISTGASCGGSRRRSSTCRPESVLCHSCCPALPRSWRRTSRVCVRTVIVVWAKHGVMARSDISVKRAVDRNRVCGDGGKLRIHGPADWGASRRPDAR